MIKIRINVFYINNFIEDFKNLLDLKCFFEKELKEIMYQVNSMFQINFVLNQIYKNEETNS